MVTLGLDDVRAGAEKVAHLLERHRGALVAADAETDDDLATLAEAALAAPGTLVAGSAGLGRALSRALGCEAPAVALPPGRARLVVVGSLHPASRAQLDALLAAGVPLVSADAQGHGDPAPAVAALAAGRGALVASATTPADRDAVARHLAAAAARILERATPDLVAVTGGDTAYALIRALRPRRFDLTGAPADGLALGPPRPRGRPLPVAAHQGGRVRRRRSPRHDPGRTLVTVSRVPVLGITMGDPAGVGPEITAKALAHPEVTAACRPVVIGDRSVMAATLALLRSPLTLHAVKSVAECTFEPGRLECLDLANVDCATLPKSTVSAEAGRAAYAYIETGVRLCQAGAIDGIVTAPVNKEALAAAGVQHSGHTEILARLTEHEGLRDAPDGQGAQGHPRDHARGAPARAGPGDARARAAASSAWRSRP